MALNKHRVADKSDLFMALAFLTRTCHDFWALLFELAAADPAPGGQLLPCFPFSFFSIQNLPRAPHLPVLPPALSTCGPSYVVDPCHDSNGLVNLLKWTFTLRGSNNNQNSILPQLPGGHKGTNRRWSCQRGHKYDLNNSWYRRGIRCNCTRLNRNWASDKLLKYKNVKAAPYTNDCRGRAMLVYGSKKSGVL